MRTAITGKILVPGKVDDTIEEITLTVDGGPTDSSVSVAEAYNLAEEELTEKEEE